MCYYMLILVLQYDDIMISDVDISMERKFSSV